MPVIQGRYDVIQNCRWLLDLATEFDIPCLVSEQYPRGLGHSVELLRYKNKNITVVEKEHFSACKQVEIQSLLQHSDKKQFIVGGVESHICVLQTVLDLQQHGKQVFVLQEAVSSRTAENKQLALQRMSHAGITLVSKEMVLFEWLQKAGTEDFRRISKRFVDKSHVPQP